MFDLQQEMAKAFLIALEGELKIAEHKANNQYHIINITKTISNGRILLQGTCTETDAPPRKGGLVKPLFSIADDGPQYRVESVVPVEGGFSVVLSTKTPPSSQELSNTQFTEVLESSNFEKMAVATRELGMSKSQHARVLLGNEALPPLIELNDFQPYKQKLNKYQYSAVVMALTHHLSLIQGPPGTGKTLVAAELSLQHNKQGRKVLMTAKTNKAADVMMLALIKHIESTDAPKQLLGTILRLGVDEKINPALKQHTLQYKVQQHRLYDEYHTLETEKTAVRTEIESIEEKIKEINEFMGNDHVLAILRNPLAEIKKIRLEQRMEELNHSADVLNTKTWKLSCEINEDIMKMAPIIITTSYQCPRRELKDIVFDAVIFDEASQATVPEAAMALDKLKDNGFLTVVGDHKQLGPIVMSDHTILKISLYDLLQRRIQDHDTDTPPNKKARLTLRKQYRMHDDIAEICRVLAYPEGLESADLDKTLKIDTSKLNGCWQDKVINPEYPVIFVSTEEIATQETKDKGGSTLNYKEVEIIEGIVKRLEEVGVSPPQIAIISAYKGQRELIYNSMRKYAVGTVDSFQGDENDVVIFDITRDNMQGAIGFMKDPNRLNVAVSRARRKLIVVGNRKNLGSHVRNQVFNKFLKAVSKNVVVIPSPEITDEDIFGEKSAAMIPEKIEANN
ncbi:MAG: AAA domain-containing protein [Candidatus Methanoperedens sp.]